MSEAILCPWCQTEILMDEEMLTEQSCPHCLNEIGEYRSISLNLDQQSRDEGKKASIKNVSEKVDEKDVDFGLDELEEYLDSMQEDPELLEFEEAITDWLKHQDEVPECSQCRESMLFAGEYTIPEGQFTPFIPKGFQRGFLKAPFAMNMYVCTACFHTSFALNEETRMIAMGLLRK